VTTARAAVLVVFAACSSGSGGPQETTAEACGACHVDQYDTWSQSRHATSTDSPVFEALLPHVERAWGSFARERCVACHSPGHGGDETIGCASCHAAIGNTAERDGALVVDVDIPIAGPFGGTAAPHATRPGELLSSSVLCGTCHEVTGPELFVEPTLTHYRASPAAEMGIGCADCHMPQLEPGPIAVGATDDRDRRAHTFVGMDPPWGASAQAAERAEQRTAALLDRILIVEIAQRPNDELEIAVTNMCFAHRVPAGVAMLRDMWIDVYVVDASGEQHTFERVIELGALPTLDGVAVPLPTDADAIVDRSLAPGEVTATSVAVVGAVRVEAVARARAFRADVLDALELADRADEVPTFEISSTIWLTEQ
jgi:hypothetical protein